MKVNGMDRRYHAPSLLCEGAGNKQDIRSFLLPIEMVC